MLIKTNDNIHSRKENLDLFALLNNYCIRKINERRKSYNTLFLEINNHLINLRYQGIPIEDIVMEASLFRNIAIAAITLEDHSFFKTIKTYGLQPIGSEQYFSNGFDWAKQFVICYGKQLQGGTQPQLYRQYCMAFLVFKQKDFIAGYHILKNLMRVQGVFLNLDFKILHLKILFEINIQKPEILEYDKIEIRRIQDTYRKLIKFELNEKRQLSYQVGYYLKFKEVYRAYIKAKMRN